MTQPEQTVLDTVVDFLHCYSSKNLEACMATVATSRPVLLFGSNADEVFKTIEDVRIALQRDFASMDDIRWGARRHVHVDAVPTLATVAIELPMSFLHEGKKVETLIRYVLTLIPEGGTWKICSGMASVPSAAGTYSFPQ